MAQCGIWNSRLKAVALGLGVALTMLTIRHGYEIFSMGHPSCENCRPDFQAIYSGAKLMWDDGARLYDLDRQLAIQKSIDPRVHDSPLAFAYPPTTALLLMPLGWLTFSSAYLVMGLCNILMLIITVRLLKKELKLNREQYQWLLLTTFCSFGAQSTILQGQTSFFPVLLVVLSMAALSRGDQSISGLFSGALFVKPQLLPVPLLIFGARRRWHALAISLLLIVAFIAGSFALVGGDAVADYFNLAQRFGASQSDLGTNPQDMYNLRALLYYVLPRSLVTIAWIVAGIFFGTAVWLLNGRTFDDEKRIALQWVGNILAMVLLSLHLHAHDLALLIPANAFVLSLYRGAVPLTISCSLLAVGLFPLLPWVIERTLPPVIPLFFVFVFVGCVGFVRIRAADL